MNKDFQALFDKLTEYKIEAVSRETYSDTEVYVMLAQIQKDLALLEARYREEVGYGEAGYDK